MPFKKTTGSSEIGTFANFKLRRWGDLNKRTVNGTAPRNEHYLKRGIKLKITREEFFLWCDQREQVYKDIKTAGGVPSIDRIDSNGHYELTNMRIISLKENIDVGREFHWNTERTKYTEYSGTDLGKCLRRERAKRNLTLRQLEKITGIANSHLSMYERGKCTPNLINFLRIVKAVGFSMDEFLASVDVKSGQGHNTKTRRAT